MKIGFIGAGNMAGAIISGVLSSGIPGSDIAVYDIDQKKCEQFDVERKDSIDEVIDFSDIVIFAVKPNVINDVICGIKKTKGKLFVSIAAGVTISKLSKYLGDRVVRVMPNTPALVGEAVCAVCPGIGASKEDIYDVVSIFSRVGKVFVMPEEKINAETAVGGSGPAYVFMMIEALADGGVACGLTRKESLQIAAQTVLGSAKMVLETGIHPGELKDMVCSPGGTTIDAVASLEKNGFRASLIEAVNVCKEKADKMTK